MGEEGYDAGGVKKELFLLLLRELLSPCYGMFQVPSLRTLFILVDLILVFLNIDDSIILFGRKFPFSAQIW